MALASDVNVIMTADLVLDKRVLQHLPYLKGIVKYGIGTEFIDVKTATDRGIPVANIPDVMTIEVAEHAVGLLLAIVRRIPQANARVKTRVWDDARDFPVIYPVPRIKGRTVGILGIGRVGRAVANILKGFDVQILGYDPYVKRETIESYGIQASDSLEDLLKQSDFIMIHTPLTSTTRHLLGKKEFELVKPTAFLVNAARGAIVDQAALYKALSGGLVAGYATDVWEQEPPEQNDPMLQLENVIITPHMAFHSNSIYAEFRRRAAEEALRILKGERPLNIVNPEVFKRG